MKINQTSEEKAEMRAGIARDVAAFKSKGGKIHIVKPKRPFAVCSRVVRHTSETSINVYR